MASNLDLSALRAFFGENSPPACLFEVPNDRAEGLATALARAYFCQLFRSGGSCSCSDCRRLESRVHPDLLWLKPDEEGSIKIESLRLACSEMGVGPLEQHSKILVLEQVEKVTLAAANAFLKTLEESAPNRRFWLFSEKPLSLPATLLSRCVRKKIGIGPSADVGTEMWAELLRKFQTQRLMEKDLKEALPNREQAHAFLNYCQKTQHEKLKDFFVAESPQRFTFYHVLDASLEWEGRLRSQANYNLMLEAWLSTLPKDL